MANGKRGPVKQASAPPAKGGETRHSPSPSRRHEILEVLYKISNIINRTREKVLKAVLREVVRVTNATSGSIAMLDKQRGVLDIETAINIPSRTWKSLKLQLGLGVTGWVAYTKKPMLVNDVRRDSHYISVKPDIRSELAVPMFLKNEVIGVINVDSTRRGAFTNDDEDLLIAVAEQSAQVIETARLYEQHKRHAEQMGALFALSQELTTPLPMERVFPLVTRGGLDLLNADVCLVLETEEEDRNALIVRAIGVRGGDGPSLPAEMDTILQRPAFLRARKPTAIEDLSRHRFTWDETLPILQRANSMLAVPLTFEEGIEGVLAVFHFERRGYNQSAMTLLELLANQAAIAIENARRRDSLEAMEENLHSVEKFSLLGTLAAEIAHEIRNPVTIINLLLDSISGEMGENEIVRNDLEIVRGKLDRIERIVDQTLSMARNREPELTPMSVNPVIIDVLNFMNYKFVKSRIEIRSSFDESLPMAAIDRGQLQQVLLNIMLNAIDAMTGGGRLTISTHLSPEGSSGGDVTITIQDNGSGIDKNALQAIFEPFYTTRANGTGLGLFICRKLINAMGGEIRVKSRIGKGSTFTITLPAANPENSTT
jgi:signal transduction histidine kinase